MTPTQFLFLTLGLYYINGVISRTCKCTHFNEGDCDIDDDCKWYPQHTLCRSIQWFLCEMDEECKENRDPVTGEPDPNWPYDCPQYEPGEDGEPPPPNDDKDEDEDITNSNHKNKGKNNNKHKTKDNDEDDLDDEDLLPQLPGTTQNDDTGLPDCAEYGQLTAQICGCAADGICKGEQCIDGPNVDCQNGGVCCCAPKDDLEETFCEGVNEPKGPGGAKGGGGGGGGQYGGAGAGQPPPQGGQPPQGGGAGGQYGGGQPPQGGGGQPPPVGGQPPQGGGAGAGGQYPGGTGGQPPQGGGPGGGGAGQQPPPQGGAGAGAPPGGQPPPQGGAPPQEPGYGDGATGAPNGGGNTKKKKKKKKKAAGGGGGAATTSSPITKNAMLKKHDFYYGYDDNSQYGQDQDEAQYGDNNGYDQQIPPQQPGYGNSGYGDNNGYYPPQQQQPMPPQTGYGYGYGYGDYGYNDQQQLTDDDDDESNGDDGAQGLQPPPIGGQPPPPPGGVQQGAPPPPQQGQPPPPPDGAEGVPPPPPPGDEPPCDTTPQPAEDADDGVSDAIGLGADINIIEQAPNVGTTIKFGYAEIFIAFICVVLLCCGAALCWNKKKYGSMKKLVNDEIENKLHFNYSTFDNNV